MNQNDEQLLWQLRSLRKDVLPTNDLWPGIAARIAQAPVASTGVEAGHRKPARSRRPVHFAPWAMAASLVLALGVAWQLRPAPDAVLPAGSDMTGAATASATPLIQREAAAMTREYDAALQELRGVGTPAAPASAALRQLDRSAAQIRTALDHDPEARFLLERLRRTYQKRLALTQRATLA